MQGVPYRFWHGGGPKGGDKGPMGLARDSRQDQSDQKNGCQPMIMSKILIFQLNNVMNGSLIQLGEGPKNKNHKILDIYPKQGYPTYLVP